MGPQAEGLSRTKAQGAERPEVRTKESQTRQTVGRALRGRSPCHRGAGTPAPNLCSVSPEQDLARESQQESREGDQ